jgi:glutamate-1-semialdehyde 2,1-aminomutase
MSLKSSECLQRAKKHMPMGVADNYRYWGEENTIFVDSMKGCSFRDVDGKEFIDFRLAYGPIILGYRDQRVDQKVIETIQNQGSMCGFSVPEESDVADLIKQLCPHIEKIRFANSGTEAVMGAVRTARGFTGRNKVIVVEGGFHGLYEEMMWKSDVESWDQNASDAPAVKAFGSGLPKQSRELIELIPLNSLEKLKETFESQGQDIAAVIIEPIMGNCGSIEATSEYMQTLRKVCDDNGSLLIIDEVKTGFRVAKGGVQELYDVRADLTTFAKAMGNGYAVAVFGGRADVMDKINIEQDGVVHGGTYTANLIGIAAAKATLEIIANTDALKTIMETGEKIKTVLGEVFDEAGQDYAFAGPSSMFGIHFSKTVPTDYRTWKPTNSALYQTFAMNLIEQGIMLEPDSREPWFICEAHKDIDLIELKNKATHAMKKAQEAHAC